MITAEKNAAIAPSESHETLALHRFSWKLSSTSMVLIGLVALQFALFCIHLRTHITDFAAVYLDQVNTYLFAYRSHYDFLTGGIQSILYDPDTPTNLKAMKGPLIPIAALLSTFIFGVNRFAVAQLNFIFFVVAEVALFRFFQKRTSNVVAFGAIGTFLLTGTHFAQFGGINDLRLDYGAMSVMLLAFISFARLLDKRDLQSMVLFVGSMVLASLTRVILLAYWLGAEVILFGVLTLRCLLKREPLKNETNIVLLLAATNTFSIIAVHMSVFWRELVGYYGACKLSGEYLMRMKEFGATSLFEMVTYYPKSFWIYFGLVFMISIAIALSGYAQRARAAFTTTTSRSDCWLVYTFFLCMTSSVMICASLYSPSPVVMGVLAGPVTIFCVLTANDSIDSQTLKRSVAIALVIAGQLWFCKESISPTYAPHAIPQAASASKHILQKLVDEVSVTENPHELYWAITHDEINEYNFGIFWYEQKQRALPQQLVQRKLAWYPETSFEDIKAKLEGADIVVAPTKLNPLLPGYFEYPGVTSIRRNLRAILTILETEFTQHDSAHLEGWGDVAIFIRRTEPIAHTLKTHKEKYEQIKR